MSMRSWTAQDLQKCAERELSWRHKVYPNRVFTKRMTQEQANAEIDKMLAIAEHYAELAKKERLL